MKTKSKTWPKSPTVNRRKRLTHKTELASLIDRGYQHFWARRMAMAVMAQSK